MNGMSTNYPRTSGTFSYSGDIGADWRCPMGFIDDLKKLLAQVDNQSAMERDTHVPQGTLSRIVNDFKGDGVGNPTLKNLAPVIDHFKFKLVGPEKNPQISEAELRDKIANEVMKALLQSGRQDVAGIVFSIITKTPIIEGSGDHDCNIRAAGNS